MKKLICEFIGTFVLLFVSTGAAVFNGGSIDTLGVAFAFGLSIVAMAYSIGTISGAHLNPAVSIAMLVNKRMSITSFIGYVIAQLLGAFAGSALVKFILVSAKVSTANLGQNLYGAIGQNGALVCETILTFIFVLVIVVVTGKKGNKNFAGLIIGLALTLVHLVGIPLTGTSVNPARSIAPAVLVGGEALTQLWVFIVAPLVGGILAALVGRFILDTEKDAEIVETVEIEEV